MRLSVILVLSTLLVAYGREQSVLSSTDEDPNKHTPGEKYPAGKAWTEVAFTDEIAAPALEAPSPKVEPPKPVVFVDPQYLDQELFIKQGYKEGPVLESEEGTPDAESYNGMKVQAGMKEQEQQQQMQQQQQQQEAAAETPEEKYVSPELDDRPDDPLDRVDFNINEVPGADPNVLKLKDHVAPEYNIPHPPLDHKITRAEYDSDVEALRQEAMVADRKMDDRLAGVRGQLYTKWQEQKAKELSDKAAKDQAAADADAQKFLAPVEVDPHGHPTDAALPVYPPYPGSENSGEQAFPQAPDYVPVDTQQAHFKKILESGAEGGVEEFREKLSQLKKRKN